MILFCRGAQIGDKVEDVHEPMRNKGFLHMPVFDGDRYLGLMIVRYLLELRKPYQSLFVEDTMGRYALMPKVSPRRCNNVDSSISYRHGR